MSKPKKPVKAPASARKRPQADVLVIGGDRAVINGKISQSAIADLKSGSESRFWLTMKSIIQANIDFLSKQVMKDNSLTDAQRNYLRRWANLNEELIELPEKSIASLEGGITNVVDFDPYAKVYSELTSNDDEATVA